jgi:hypothetical protein
MSVRYLTILLGAGCALGLSLQTANAATRFVGACHPGSYSTIQAAVTASSSGDTVAVCAGTYPEEVTITSNITLFAHAGGTVNVVAPAGGFVQNVAEVGCSQNCAVAQIAVVAPATSVTVRGLTVDGTGNNATGCGVDYVGIYYQNSGGTITGNTVENQLYPPALQGCQGGQGIFAENATTGTALTITKNTVSNFDKNGITLNGNYYGSGGGSAMIAQNTVTGVADINTAQNGIQVAFGATGTISKNTISNIFYDGYYMGPYYYTASGILLYDIPYGTTPAPVVSDNTLSGAQTSVAFDAVNGALGHFVPVTGNLITGAMYGVQLFSDGVDFSPPVSDDFINVSKNTIGLTNPGNGGTFDGIDACSDNNRITNNTINGDPNGSQSAVHLDSQCMEPDSSASGVGNVVLKNTMNYVCAGILSGQPAGQNTIGANNVYGSSVGTHVVYNSNTCSGSDERYGGSGKKMAPARTLLVLPVGPRSSQQQ